MSSSDTSGSGTIKAGDHVEIVGVPVFTWKVQEVKECLHSPPSAFRHDRYLISAPEGASDWWCFYKVRKVRD